MSVEKKMIIDALKPIKDPELGMSIMELNLVDKLEVKNDNVDVQFHLTSPYCPPPFALKIVEDMKNAIKAVEGVKDIKLKVTGHYMDEVINETIKKI